MDLFIQVDDDGKPINHPMLLQSIHWIDPNFDPEYPPPGYVRFKRIPPPEVGHDQTYDVHYKWIDGVFQDVYMVREMTAEEKYERDLNHEVMMQSHRNRLEALETDDSTVESTIPTTMSMQNLQMKLGASTPIQLPPIFKAGQEIPTAESIISNLVCFSDDVIFTVDPQTYETSAYYTFPLEGQVVLDLKNPTMIDSINDLPTAYEGKVGDVYDVHNPRETYAWSGTDWIKISDETKPVPDILIKDVKEYVKSLGN